jgi:hypothetical protein
LEDADYLKGLDISFRNSHLQIYGWRSVGKTITALTAVESIHLKQGEMLYQFDDMHYIERVKCMTSKGVFLTYDIL